MPDDLELRRAEDARYEDVEIAPTIVAERPSIDLGTPDESPRASAPFLASYADRAEPSPSRRWPLVIALIAGLAIGFAGGYAAGGRQNAPSSPTAVALASPPRNAPTGSTSPAAAPAPREYTEDAVKKPAEKAPVTIPPSRPLVVLKQETTDKRGRRAVASNAPAVLDIESRPAGAKVFLDNKQVGTTPYSTTKIVAGRHGLRLERSGYRRWTSIVIIVAGKRHRVTASLEK